MRYGDWDVLLFPYNSKTPIQEFRTQCFVSRDNYNAPPAQTSSFPGVRYMSSDGKPLTQVPVLTTFVGSLAHDAPFRVSIHSWDEPKASRILESLARSGDAITFEARVYVDGLLLASSIFHPRTLWPHVIDLCSAIDKDGYQEPLRFPPFHQEILHASDWDAGQLLGRIRVVMTEGFTSSNTLSPSVDSSKLSFSPVREIVVFSFQHAPLHILEFSGIAWPNPGMWTQAQSRTIATGPERLSTSTAAAVRKDRDANAHAHSPNRSGNFTTAGIVPTNLVNVPHARRSIGCEEYQMQSRGEPASWKITPQDEGWGLSRPDQSLADPFLETGGLKTGNHCRAAKKSSEDTSMPDISSGQPSRSISGMTGVSYEQRQNTCEGVATADAMMHQLVQALSPLKSDGEGGNEAEGGAEKPRNPANTPASTRDFSKSGTSVHELRQTSRGDIGTAIKSDGSSLGTSLNAATSRSPTVNNQAISVGPGAVVQSRKEVQNGSGKRLDVRIAGQDFSRRSKFHEVDQDSMHAATDDSNRGYNGSWRGHRNADEPVTTNRVVTQGDTKRKRPLVEQSTLVEHDRQAVARLDVDDDGRYATEHGVSSSPSSWSLSPTKKKASSKLTSTEVLVQVHSPRTPDSGAGSGLSIKLAHMEDANQAESRP